MPQRESMTIAGDHARVNAFPVRRNAMGRRKCKSKPTSEIQAKLNEKNKIHAITDLVNANFTTDDYFLTLTYSEAEYVDDAEAAKRDIKNFFRRINALLRKRGLDSAKYIYVTERGERYGRLHHHVMISCDLTLDEIKLLWGKGSVQSEALEFNEYGLQGLARYVIKTSVYDPRGGKQRMSYRAWSGSKNLSKPIKKQNDYRLRAKDVAYMDKHPDDLDYARQLYPGWIVTKIEPTAISETEPDKSPIPRAHFITIYMYRADTELFGEGLRKKNQRKRKELMKRQ